MGEPRGYKKYVNFNDLLLDIDKYYAGIEVFSNSDRNELLKLPSFLKKDETGNYTYQGDKYNEIGGVDIQGYSNSDGTGQQIIDAKIKKMETAVNGAYDMARKAEDNGANEDVGGKRRTKRRKTRKSKRRKKGKTKNRNRRRY